MFVRFKFRSSSVFDSVNLNGCRSISVRDLRSKIVAQKNLQICKDFDLLISDSETGKAFEDEGHQINEGSSVVIKRVPAHRDLDAGNAVRKDGVNVDRVATAPSENVIKEKFDDFGADLYPILQKPLPESYDNASYLGFKADQKAKVVPRYSKPSGSGCQNIERSDISEGMPKEGIGDNCNKESDIDEIQKQIKLEPKKEVQQKMNEHIVMPLAMTEMDLPTEMGCSLCGTIFQEAVMIPCCQHSFCEKCIRSALAVSGRCPKCSSMKCTADSLLPNVSLRLAIKHFLEAQAASNALENKITQYVPDLESGIHVKEVSCAMSIRQKEPQCRCSPSAASKGSNHVMAGVVTENKQTGGRGKLTHLPLEIKKMKGDGNCSAEVSNHMSGFKGVHGSSMLVQNFLREEDGSGTTFMPSSWHRKGDRSCCMCGSPLHLIRDCPMASNSYPLKHTGGIAFTGGMPVYGHALWHGNTFPQTMAYMNMHGAPSMMPFTPAMGHISPLGIPPYVPSMYPVMGEPYGFITIGSVQSPLTLGAERRLKCQAFAKPLTSEQKHRNRHPESEHNFDHLPEDYYYRKNERVSRERRPWLDKETNGSFSNDDCSRIHNKCMDNKHYGLSHRQPDIQSDEELSFIGRKYERGSHQSFSGRENKTRRCERTNSESQDCSDSSHWHCRERKRCHGNCFENQSERRGQDRSRKKTSDDYTKVGTDHKKLNHRHHNRAESSSESNLSDNGRHHCKRNKASHSSRSSRQNMPNTKEDRLEYERWKMVDFADDEYRGVDHDKRRRTH